MFVVHTLIIQLPQVCETYSFLIPISNGGFFERCFCGEGYSREVVGLLQEEICVDILVPVGIEPGTFGMID